MITKEFLISKCCVFFFEKDEREGGNKNHEEAASYSILAYYLYIRCVLLMETLCCIDLYRFVAEDVWKREEIEMWERLSVSCVAGVFLAARRESLCLLLECWNVATAFGEYSVKLMASYRIYKMCYITHSYRAMLYTYNIDFIWRKFEGKSCSFWWCRNATLWSHF